MEIPLFKAGRGGPQIFSASDMNLLVRVLRALVNPSIVRGGNKDKVTISDGNFQILLSDADGGGTTVTQYVLTDAEPGDYFVARELLLDPEEGYIAGEADVYIARPYPLRSSPFDGKTVEVQVESWDGATLSAATKTYSFDYKSANFRLKTDVDTDIEERQAIIPRFVPAVIEDGGITNEGATIIYAVDCDELDVLANDTPVTKLALCDGWAWARVI